MKSPLPSFLPSLATFSTLLYLSLALSADHDPSLTVLVDIRTWEEGGSGDEFTDTKTMLLEVGGGLLRVAPEPQSYQLRTLIAHSPARSLPRSLTHSAHAHSIVMHFLLHTANPSERLTDGRTERNGSSWRTDKTADWKRSGGGNGSNKGGRGRWLQGGRRAGPGARWQPVLRRHRRARVGYGRAGGQGTHPAGAEPDSPSPAEATRRARRKMRHGSRVRQTPSAAGRPWPPLRSESNPMTNGEMGRICGNVIRRALSAP